MNATQRQRDKSRRMKAAGFVRVSIWVPGDVHDFNVEQANRRGITLQEQIIRKMRRT